MSPLQALWVYLAGVLVTIAVGRLENKYSPDHKVSLSTVVPLALLSWIMVAALTLFYLLDAVPIQKMLKAINDWYMAN